LDLIVDFGNHLRKKLDQLILVLAFVVFAIFIGKELVLQEVIMALFTRANVVLRVREQVIRTEGNEVVLAYS